MIALWIPTKNGMKTITFDTESLYIMKKCP